MWVTGLCLVTVASDKAVGGVGFKDEGFIIFLSTGYQENNKLDTKLDIQILDGREEKKTLGGRGGG